MTLTTLQAHTVRLILDIQKHEAFDPTEQTHKLHFLHALKSVENLFERSCFEPGHATATAWVTNPYYNKLYLIEHPNIGAGGTSGSGLLMPAGGHADGDANLENVAKKEKWEELALRSGAFYHFGNSGIFDVDTHQVPANPKKGEPEHLHFNLGFLFIYDDTQPMPPSPEGIKTGWYTLEETAERFTVGGGRYRGLQKIRMLNSRY